MPQEILIIDDLPASTGQRILRLNGPILLSNLFQFQSMVRSNNVPILILDFAGVPYIDSAGIGALVGAHVSHSKEGRRLALVGVCERVLNALRVTRVDGFFKFYNNVEDAERSATEEK